MGGETLRGRFETRRDAEMTVERLVQEHGIERTESSSPRPVPRIPLGNGRPGPMPRRRSRVPKDAAMPN